MLPIILYISIALANNAIAYNTLKDLKSIEIPPESKIEWSESKSGKFVGNGNGMQYLGVILVSSDLSEYELENYYQSFDYYIEVESLQNENNYKITMHGDRNIESELINTLLDMDIRGH